MSATATAAATAATLTSTSADTNNANGTMMLRPRGSAMAATAAATAATLTSTSADTNNANGTMMLRPRRSDQNNDNGSSFLDILLSNDFDDDDDEDYHDNRLSSLDVDEDEEDVARGRAKKRRVVGDKPVEMTAKEKKRLKLPKSNLTLNDLDGMQGIANARNEARNELGLNEFRRAKMYKVPEMKREYLADVSKFSPCMQKGIAKYWSEYRLECRGILPLRFYTGKSILEKILTRIIWQCQNPINERVAHVIGEVEIAPNGQKQLWGASHFTPFLNDTQNCPRHVLCMLCMAVLKANASENLAVHAAVCNPAIRGTGCEGGCDRAWKVMGPKYTSNICGVIDGETARLRSLHLTNCKGSLTEIKEKLGPAILYHTLCPDIVDEKLTLGQIGVPKAAHPGGRADLIRRNSALPTPFSNEVIEDGINTFCNDSKMAALYQAIRYAVGRGAGRELPAAGTAKEWLVGRGYTRERGFFYEDTTAYKEWRDEQTKKIKAGTVVGLGGGGESAAIAFEFSFGDTVIVRTIGRNNAKNKFLELNTEFKLGLTRFSVLIKMKETSPDWNGLNVSKNRQYNGSKFGVTDEAALSAWIKTRQP